MFVNEILEGAHGRGRGHRPRQPLGAAGGGAGDRDRCDPRPWLAGSCRCPTKRERRLELRLRAAELVGLIEGTDDADPETLAARAAFTQELATVGERAGMATDAARAAGLDPLTFREIALDTDAGANLLEILPLPDRFSYSAFSTYETCPMRYAFSYVYGIPPPSRPVAAFAFGGTAHEAFEAFTKERRERAGPRRGAADPRRPRAPLPRAMAADRLRRPHHRGGLPAPGDDAARQLLERRGRHARRGDAEELKFELVIEDPSGAPPVVVTGSIDRIDRLPSGGIEVIDYKTGKLSSQKDVHESLQLSIYALACRDALGLGTPERVTLYFTESATRMSTTRTDADLDAARADILARTARIRSGDFAATPSAEACQWCDYARLCPSRM